MSLPFGPAPRRYENRSTRYTADFVPWMAKGSSKFA